MVLCAFSPFPRTSNATLYLPAACRNSMVFLPLLRFCYQHKCGCENCKQQQGAFFPFSFLVLQACSPFDFFVFEMEQPKGGRQSWTPEKCFHVSKCRTRNLCNNAIACDSSSCCQCPGCCMFMSVRCNAASSSAGLNSSCTCVLQTHEEDPENDVSNVWVFSAAASAVINNYPPGGHTGTKRLSVVAVEESWGNLMPGEIGAWHQLGRANNFFFASSKEDQKKACTAPGVFHVLECCRKQQTVCDEFAVVCCNYCIGMSLDC